MTLHFKQFCNQPLPQAGPLADLRADEPNLHTLFDTIGVALMVTDGNARILYANAAARRMLAGHIALAHSSTYLAAATVFDSTILRSVIAKAAKGAITGTIPLRNSERCVKAMAWIYPIFGSAQIANSKRGLKVAVAIRDLTSSNRPCLDLFANCYGLTKTEKKLLSELADAKTLAEASRTLDISINTTKTHLNRIFGKTGVNRQVDLIALVEKADFPMFRTPIHVQDDQLSCFSNSKLI